jgi:hypothetical protein
MTFRVLRRRRVLVNTDPQRRCYNGCHFSSEMRWSEWGILVCDLALANCNLEEALDFWCGLNDYAVSQRGESARQEFKVEEILEGAKS